MNPFNRHTPNPCSLWVPPSDLTGSARIAAINDYFRKTFGNLSGPVVPGRSVITQGIASLGPLIQIELVRRVREHDDFPSGDDPHGEHDFGSFDIDDTEDKIFWKIDVYADDTFEWGAENPGDLEASYRVLTILFASEY